MVIIEIMTCRLFPSIPFVFRIPLSIGCSCRHFTIASLISGVDRLEVINSTVLQALLRAAVKRSKVLFEWVLTSLLLPTTAQTALSNHRLNYNIINTQKYEPLVIIMVKSGNYNLENKTFILSVNYGTFPYFVERVATLSLNIAVTLHDLQCYAIIM